MTAAVSLLRAINVGGRQVKKDALVAIHEAAGCLAPAAYLASGNVVFTTREKNLARLSARIEAEFERTAGFRAEAILRTRDELVDVEARNPFAGRSGIEGSKLLVTFLAAAPRPEAIRAALAVPVAPEEMHILGCELYIHFPNGMGRSKFPTAKVARALGEIPGTARNWNTLVELIRLASARIDTDGPRRR